MRSLRANFVGTTILGVYLSVSGCTENKVSPGETTQPTAPWFEEQAKLRGLDFQHQSGHTERYLFPEIVGGGAALADLDGDGDLDAYLVQSGRLFTDDAPGNQLFLNDGDGYFEEAAGGDAADNGYGMGVTAGDYDNDGDIDLYVTNFGPNVLLRNNGKGEFEDVSVVAGVDHSGWGTAAVFLDLDVDGDLDLFVVNYVNWSLETEQDCLGEKTGLVDYCAPMNYGAPAGDLLYRNNGDGTFTDISEEAGLSTAFGNGLGVIGADFNGDGLTDIFVANDAMMNQLWLNRGDLRFENEALIWGCAVDGHGIAKAGMGVAAVDHDNDGDTDLLVVNLAGQTDSFFRNEGSYFVDATVSVGLTTVTKRYTRFGVLLADFDNDTQLDLFEANGAVTHSPEVASEDDYAEPNLLLQGLTTKSFKQVEPLSSTSTSLTYTSRGMAMGDIDNDGGLDLLIVNRDGPANLLMNQIGSRSQWIRFEILNANGHDAHGATVSANVGSLRVHRDVQTAGSYLASNDPRVHFGLGSESQVRNVVVRWPGGVVEEFGDFKAGQTVQLRQNARLASKKEKD
ncbi:MAG: CRTAC1 family protein [Gammaproteobacteria bacterium]|nr:CRTAC1 family protein [Gammaproteobacteria bacterium]